MRQEDVVVLGQEADRRRRVRVRDRRVGQVEQLAAGLVAVRDERRAQPLEDLAQPGQPRPGPGVGGRRGAERREVAADRLVRSWVAVHRGAQPRLGGRVRRPPGPAPQAARRDLDEREQEAGGIRQRVGVAVRPARTEGGRQGRRRARLGLERLVAGGDDRLDVHPDELLGERRTLPHPGPEARQHGDQPAAVVGGDEVEGAAQGPQADGPALFQQVAELVGVERLDPGPQRDVRVDRLLRLDPDERLDHVARGLARPREQALAEQEGPVERAAVEDRRVDVAISRGPPRLDRRLSS